MVNGLQIFREAFESFSDQYILIGGTACDLLLDDEGLPFRASIIVSLVSFLSYKFMPFKQQIIAVFYMRYSTCFGPCV